MAISEVKRFMKHIEENRKAFDLYNEKLSESRWPIYVEPTVVTSGYYATPMLPEKLEDDLLQRIIELDEKSARKLEKICQSQEEKNKIKNRMVEKFDEFRYKGQAPVEYILTKDEAKRQKIFSRLAELARADGFDISTDDLLYYIGKAVMVVIKEHPDYNDTQIFVAVLRSFD